MKSIISVHNLGKCYRLGHSAGPNTLRDRLAHGFTGLFSRRARKSPEEFWALRDVSFEVQEGEVLGIIGRNGAGKSTLLKILSQITEPTTGEVRVRGRVASLLEVGTGFHGELSGRENIYLNGAILGMAKAEIHRKFDEIVAFSGVEKFLDTPVKRYSSGMTVRLAFSVAAHLEPEILLVDEVLAVGDVEFQKKCLGKMGDVARGGRTVLFVSHNMVAVENLCTRAILLDGGEIQTIGQVGPVLERYAATASVASGNVECSRHPSRVPGGSPIIRKFRIVNADEIDTARIGAGEGMAFVIDLETIEPLFNLHAGLHIYNWMGQRVTSMHTAYQTSSSFSVKQKATLKCSMQNCYLIPGVYRVVIGLASGYRMADRIDPVATFEIVPRDVFGTGKLPPARDGVFLCPASWLVTDEVVA